MKKENGLSAPRKCKNLIEIRVTTRKDDLPALDSPLYHHHCLEAASHPRLKRAEPHASYR
ncbi:hypothetical protein CC80DRAFT_285164 [Byssothecium circinans]|uniref:Uncharacterized protein n=1 Tax=Byssothecium circinans TaxID=147558 RepID=A0A6A5U806_9PLEO|nr:hypothetical protein CC80DRAFT_285164 [Byssothecium circinans]